MLNVWGCKAYKVREHFLKPDEENLLADISPKVGGKERAATLLWSAKEAAYKFLNDKHAYLLSDIHLYKVNNRSLKVDFPNHHLQATVEYDFYPHCVQTSCWKNED